MYAGFFKRFIDFWLSLFALVILSPALLLLTVVGAVEMKGNPFYLQKRPGKRDKKTGREKIIRLIKFRSMTNEKDADGKLLPDKDRLNKYGRLIRATSLDELPSLLNILKGDLSIVGPRPLAVVYLPFYTKKERHRHDVRPGLTGLAQVNGRNNLSWEEKFAYDLEYVDHITFPGDLKILFKTVKKVFIHEGIGQGEEMPTSLHVERAGWTRTKEGAVRPADESEKQGES
ncbi:MAG: sugar transferase [Eubacteriales bacterium]|nr:sugar transferase [Eubacteriales bacterium]